MKYKAFNTAIAALSLLVAPTVAAAQPIATPLTQPAQESVEGDSALRGAGFGSGFFVLGLAVIFIGLGIYVAVDKDNDQPNSP